MAVTSRRSATSCAGEREGAEARALAGRCRRSDALACCELLATATRGWGSSTLLRPKALPDHTWEPERVVPVPKGGGCGLRKARGPLLPSEARWLQS